MNKVKNQNDNHSKHGLARFVMKVLVIFHKVTLIMRVETQAKAGCKTLVSTATLTSGSLAASNLLYQMDGKVSHP